MLCPSFFFLAENKGAAESIDRGKVPRTFMARAALLLFFFSCQGEKLAWSDAVCFRVKVWTNPLQLYGILELGMSLDFHQERCSVMECNRVYLELLVN